MKSRRFKTVFYLSALLVLILIFVFIAYNFSKNKEASTIKTTDRRAVLNLPEDIQAKEQVLISIPQRTLEQSDSFVVLVENAPEQEKVLIEWNGREYNFLRQGDKFLAILGVDAKKEPGNYPINIFIGEKIFTDNITILKRNFPITELVVTPKLEQEGHTPSSIQSNIASENEQLNSVLIYNPKPYFKKSFISPLEKIFIVGAYGNIRKSGEVRLQHLGTDLDAPEDTPVFAINDGEVVLAKEFTEYGKTIVIDHGLGVFSLYLHLNNFSVDVGARVMREQVIAVSGNTGYSISPHLHFSIRVRNNSVDPLRFIEKINSVLPKQ